MPHLGPNWRMAKGGGTKGGIWKCPFQPEKPWKPPENTLIFEVKVFQAKISVFSGGFQIPPFVPPPFAILGLDFGKGLCGWGSNSTQGSQA